MTKDPTTRIFWLVAALVAAIALGSFALSYNALLALAIANGIPGRLAWIWPLIVDVSVIVFTGAILVSQLQKRGAKLAIGLTLFYAVVTIVGNVLHAPPSALGWFVASLPPLSLIFATEMLRAMSHHIILQHSAVVTLQQLRKDTEQTSARLATMAAQVDAKQRQLDELQAAIEAAKTNNVIDFAATMQQSKRQKIVERRQEVFQLLEAGHSDKEIAAQLERDVRTIRSDIKALNGKAQR